jgi:hypothetical protein
VGLLDELFLLALMLLPVAWILDPLRLSLGPVHLSLHWGWKPVLAPVLFLAGGWGLRRVLRARDPASPQWGGSKALWCVSINLLVFYLGWAALETWLTVKGINTTEIGMTGPAAPGAEPGLERIASEIHKTLRGIVGRKKWTQRRSSGPW